MKLAEEQYTENSWWKWLKKVANINIHNTGWFDMCTVDTDGAREIEKKV